MELNNPELNPEPDGTKVWWRHWSVVFILAAMAAFVIWALLQAGPWLENWRNKRLADSLRRQAEEQLRNDKYGGKTPEETFDMFITALEAGDIELASKYFVIQKQDDWLRTLEEYREQELLLDFIGELKNTKNSWVKTESKDSNVIQFDSATLVEKDTVITMKNGDQIKLPKGNYASSTIFEKYLSGVWKISML